MKKQTENPDVTQLRVQCEWLIGKLKTLAEEGDARPLLQVANLAASEWMEVYKKRYKTAKLALANMTSFPVKVTAANVSREKLLKKIVPSMLRACRSQSDFNIGKGKQPEIKGRVTKKLMKYYYELRMVRGKRAWVEKLIQEGADIGSDEKPRPIEARDKILEKAYALPDSIKTPASARNWFAVIWQLWRFDSGGKPHLHVAFKDCKADIATPDKAQRYLRNTFFRLWKFSRSDRRLQVYTDSRIIRKKTH